MSKLIDNIYKGLTIRNDINAVAKGKILHRIKNRLLGKALKGLFK